METHHFLMSPRQEPISPYLSEMTEPSPQTPLLTQSFETDVAIIGGGYTGLSAAMTLAQKGVEVHVLEARHVGWGGSGRAWGQVAAFAKTMPASVEKAFGAHIGGRINDAAAQGPALVFDLIKQYGMQCSASRVGNLLCAHTPAKAAELTATFQDLRKRGLPVQLLQGEAACNFIGSRRYDVALFDPRGGAVNPLGFARGLARAAIQAGANVHQNTPVLELEPNGSSWRLRLAQGSVRAACVILATNAFGDDNLFPGLRRAALPVRAYQLISEPLHEDALATVLPGRQPLNDTRKLFSGVRLWPDGRLHVGADGPLFALDGKPCITSATRRITMLFPQLADLRWAYGWAGWVDMVPDGYPRIYALAPNLWAGFGFSGRGIALSTIMGKDLAALAMGGGAKDVIFPISTLKPLWYYAMHKPLITGLAQWYRILDRWHDMRFG